ncbi:unnamed protein product [Pedinophyceae sp. YPF-701]|nr:unnamed protein product [Pedinophyceae sp. YPF-701]
MDMELVDRNTKKVVQEALRICRERGYRVDTTISAFVVRALDVSGQLQVKTGFGLNQELDHGGLMAVSEMAADHLLEHDSPYLCTVRLQLGMEQKFFAEKGRVEEELRGRDARMETVLNLLCDPKLTPGMAPEDFRRFWDKVLEYICIKTSMDPALENEEAAAQVRAALESVLPEYIMPRFVGLTREEKEAQLDEVASITLGICSYNLATGKGALCLPPSTSVASYQHQARSMFNQVSEQVQELHEVVQGYLAVLAAMSRQHEPTHERFVRLRQEVTNVQQELAYLLQLREDVSGGTAAAEDIHRQHQATCRELLALLSSNPTSVPKEKVYPLFDQLGASALAIMDEAKMLEIRVKLFHALNSLSGGYSRTLQPEDVGAALDYLDAGGAREAPIQSAFVPSSSPSPGRRRASDAGVMGELMEPGMEVPPLQFGGYCPVSIVVHGGVLVPADITQGFVRLGDDQVFGCVSQEYLETFLESPVSYLRAIESVARATPELVKLLGLTETFPSLWLESIIELVAKGVHCEYGTQTVLHPVERNMDMTYEWNVWALRRRALKVANLRQKATHSTQSVLSHFRRENQSQTYPQKEVGQQTRMDKGQGMPKKLRYVAGLRGSNKTKMSVVNIDLDVGQPHQF